jgi:sulfite exporter TauE/SafE
MLTLVTTVVVASLVGSLHCAGMCGPLVAFAVGGDASDRIGRISVHVVYHLCRAVPYTVVGVVCGALGAALDLGGDLVGVQRAAAVLAGGTMIVFGLVAVLRYYGVRMPAPPVPRFLREVMAGVYARTKGRSATVRAAIIGLCTVFLPCGWLYAFAVIAAGTADPVRGGLVMFAFWVGTVPVLTVVGVGVQALRSSFGRRIPLMTSLLIVGIGVLMVAKRASLSGHEFARTAPTVPVSDTESVSRVRDLDSSKMPCCQQE